MCAWHSAWVTLTFSSSLFSTSSSVLLTSSSRPLSLWGLHYPAEYGTRWRDATQCSVTLAHVPRLFCFSFLFFQDPYPSPESRTRRCPEPHPNPSQHANPNEQLKFVHWLAAHRSCDLHKSIFSLIYYWLLHMWYERLRGVAFLPYCLRHVAMHVNSKLFFPISNTQHQQTSYILDVEPKSVHPET